MIIYYFLSISIFMAALRNRAGHYIFALWFLLSSSSVFLSFFSSPNLSRRRLDVCHTSTHDVALVRIYDAGLKCAARGLLEMQVPNNRQKVAMWDHPTNLSSYIFASKALIDNRKKTC